VHTAADCKGVVKKPIHSEGQEDVVPCGTDREIQAVEIGARQWWWWPRWWQW